MPSKEEFAQPELGMGADHTEDDPPGFLITSTQLGAPMPPASGDNEAPPDLTASVQEAGEPIGADAEESSARKISDPVALEVEFEDGPPRRSDPAIEAFRRYVTEAQELEKFRRYFPEIRGLASFDDIPFGLIIRGELTAIFQRHPSYHPTIVDEFRAEFASRQGKTAPDLSSLVSALEARMDALNARLGEQSAPASNRPRRPTPYKPRG